jgi:hypothetical protein
MNTSLTEQIAHLRKQSFDFHQQIEAHGIENMAQLLEQWHNIHDALVLIKHLKLLETETQANEAYHTPSSSENPQETSLLSSIEEETIEVESFEIFEEISEDEIEVPLSSGEPETAKHTEIEESTEVEPVFTPIAEEAIDEIEEETPTEEEHSTSMEEMEINTMQGSVHQEEVKESFRYVQSDVNEKNKRDDDSLANKLKKTKIEDLKSAVALNQRFLFSNELFNGNMEAFNRALNELNHLENMDEALRYIDLQLSKNYNWKKDSDTVGEFLALIERRFI